jgi:hypothetical protein
MMLVLFRFTIFYTFSSFQVINISPSSKFIFYFFLEGNIRKKIKLEQCYLRDWFLVSSQIILLLGSCFFKHRLKDFYFFMIFVLCCLVIFVLCAILFEYEAFQVVIISLLLHFFYLILFPLSNFLICGSTEYIILN